MSASRGAARRSHQRGNPMPRPHRHARGADTLAAHTSSRSWTVHSTHNAAYAYAGAAPAGLGQGPTLAAANAEERPSFFAQNFVARMSEKNFRPFNFFFNDHTQGPMVCTGNEYGRKHIILTPIHLNSTLLLSGGCGRLLRFKNAFALPPLRQVLSPFPTHV